MSEDKIMRSTGKTHLVASAGGHVMMKHQPFHPNNTEYRDKVQTESSEDDFDQFLMQKATPKTSLRKPRTASKKESVTVVSSDSDSFENFLNRVKTPNAKPKTTAEKSEEGLKNFIHDELSSDDDFIVEKKKPSTCKVYKTLKTNISQPPVRKPLTKYESPVFISDSDDDDIVSSKSIRRRRHRPCHPSSRTKTGNILEDISPSSSPSSSYFLPTFLAPTPSLSSFPPSLPPPQQIRSAPPQQTRSAPPQQTHSAPPQQTHSAPPKQTHSAPPQQTHSAPPQQTHSAPPKQTHSAPSTLQDSVSSEEEFLSLLDRVRKNSTVGSNTPTPTVWGQGSSQRLHAPVPVPTATPSISKPSTNGQKGAGPPPGRRMPKLLQTPVLAPLLVTQTEPRPSTFSRLGTCRTAGCFLQSLSTDTRSFKQTKENLTVRLFQLYNTSVFESKLPACMSVSWNKKMRKTAGYCITGQEKVGGNRYARIELSEKVCDSADRLRDTLIHEMCHAATWLINGVRDGHGPLWKLYASKAKLAHPELPMVTRCHNYDINYKYKYQCGRCKNTIGRHSKSLDTERFVCAFCTGPLVLLISSDRKPRAITPFASFVKENYGSMRQQLMGQSHANVMRKLSADFANKTHLS